MPPRARIILILAFATSVGLHGVAYASLTGNPHVEPVWLPISEVSFEVKEKPAPAPEPPGAPARSETAVTPTPRPARALPTRATVPPSAASPAPPAAALDLSGVTLTNDSGAGFAMPLGDGSALRGPIVGGHTPVTAAPVNAPSTKPSSAPALVAAADLSEHPRPPSLEGLLRANYPDEARQRGLRGSARVRARIDADGVIRAAQLLNESATGFGAACRRTVLGSRWSAPRDKNGGAVATEIVYTCHFEVGQ